MIDDEFSRAKEISIHVPRMRDDNDRGAEWQIIVISIHVPRMRDDLVCSDRFPNCLLFQSTSLA